MSGFFNSIKNAASMAVNEVVRQSAQELVDNLTKEFEEKLNTFEDKSINFDETAVFNKFSEEILKKYDDNAGDSSKSDQWAIRRRMLGRNIQSKQESFQNKCKLMRESNLQSYEIAFNSSKQSFDDKIAVKLSNIFPLSKSDFYEVATSLTTQTKNKFKSQFQISDTNFVVLSEKLDAYMDEKIKKLHELNIDAVRQALLKLSLQFGYNVNVQMIT